MRPTGAELKNFSICDLVAQQRLLARASSGRCLPSPPMVWLNYWLVHHGGDRQLRGEAGRSTAKQGGREQATEYVRGSPSVAAIAFDEGESIQTSLHHMSMFVLFFMYSVTRHHKTSPQSPHQHSSRLAWSFPLSPASKSWMLPASKRTMYSLHGRESSEKPRRSHSRPMWARAAGTSTSFCRRRQAFSLEPARGISARIMGRLSLAWKKHRRKAAVATGSHAYCRLDTCWTVAETVDTKEST